MSSDGLDMIRIMSYFRDNLLNQFFEKLGPYQLLLCHVMNNTTQPNRFEKIIIKILILE